jgi:arginine utilization protein RocB
MDQRQDQSLCERIALDLVARGSVTGTLDEVSFGPWLAGYLDELGCFGDTANILTFPAAPDDGRLVVAMLVRGGGQRTVVLTGHYDTVTIQDYGQLMGLACQPAALREALLVRLQGDSTATALRAYADLQSGAFLPGRGLLDMKGGLAAGLAAIASIVSAGSFDGNLLFIAVPDEESNSAGARAAAACLGSIAADHQLAIAAAINLDAIADDGDGTAGRVLALGTVGKVLPTAFVVGRPVHSGYALRGVNAAVLAAAIAARLEWVPELTDDSAGVPGTAASLLSFKDGKAGYDVTTPGTAFLFWNVINLRRDPVQVLDVVEQLVREATADCLAQLAGRAAASRNAADALGMATTVEVVRYSALLAEVLARDSSIADARKREAAASAGKDLPERCRLMTALLWERSGRAGPAVVLGLGSIPYLATVVEDVRLFAVFDEFLSEARFRHGVEVRAEPYFAGISDMSFFGQADDTAFAALAADTPVWDAAVGLKPGALAQVPTINLGPWGRDYHTPLERIHVDYGFRVLPALIRDLAQRILAD